MQADLAERPAEPGVLGRMLMAVAWPAFLVACLLEAGTFALVDPQELNLGGVPLGWSRQAVYTFAFFAYWLAGVVSSTMALWLLRGSPGSPGPVPEQEPG